jgi:hypothetical protein
MYNICLSLKGLGQQMEILRLPVKDKKNKKFMLVSLKHLLILKMFRKQHQNICSDFPSLSVVDVFLCTK